MWKTLKSLGLPALIMAALLLPSGAQPKKGRAFHDTDIVIVLRSLAKEMGRNLYAAAGVKGSVTIETIDIEPEAAIRLVLQQEDKYAYKLVGSGHIVVAPRGRLAEQESTLLEWMNLRNSPSREVLLAEADAVTVLAKLEGRFPEARLISHHRKNAIIMAGRDDDRRTIREEIAKLDTPQNHSGFPVREEIRFGNASEAYALLNGLVPGLTMWIDPKNGVLVVEGRPSEIQMVRELLTGLGNDSTGRAVSVDDISPNP